MPMIGRHSGINVSERKDVFEHKEFTGADADTSTNSGFLYVLCKLSNWC